MTCRTVTSTRTAPTPTAHSGSPNIIPLLQKEPVSRASTTVRTHTSPRSPSDGQVSAMRLDLQVGRPSAFQVGCLTDRGRTPHLKVEPHGDRKSTRLNSSH